MDPVQEWVLLSTDSAAGRLQPVVDEMRPLRAELADLVATEAMVVEAATRLADAAGWLAKAKDWANCDTFLGGGLLGDAMKYDRIDRAKWSIDQAEVSLRTMGEALTGIGMSAVRGVEIDSLTGVFDVWFDNVVSDMAVRGRLRDAADRVRDAQAMVANVQSELTGRRERAAAHEAALVAEREELLLTAARG